MRKAASLALSTLLIYGCSSPCGPLWGLGTPAPVPAPTGTTPTARPSGSGPLITPTATPRPTASTAPVASPTASPTAAPTPVPTAAPADDASQAILGIWYYSDLKYSSKLTFFADGSMRTEVGTDGSIPLYQPARYTVDGFLVQLSKTDVPGFEGGSATVSFNADRSRMTTAGGKVYRRQG